MESTNLTSTEATPKVSIIALGLIAGLIGIIVTVIMYSGGISLWMNSFINYVPTVATLSIAVFGAVKQKKFQGGYLEFGDALKITFGILTISTLLYFIGQYILLNLIDPEFAAVVMHEVGEKTAATLRARGLPEGEIEKVLESIDSYNNYTLDKMLIGFGLFCIGNFIIALIISAIVKRKQPIFD